MCRWCEGEFGRQDDFARVTRPAERLAGRRWQGSYGEAAAGAVAGVLEAVRGVLRRQPVPLAGPLVSLTWNDRPDGFSAFVGFSFAGVAAPPAADGLELFELPALTYVSAWHGAGDGAVVEHYRGLLHWMQTERIRRDMSAVDHREEYPLDADFAAADALRLMIPAEAAASRFAAG